MHRVAGAIEKRPLPSLLGVRDLHIRRAKCCRVQRLCDATLLLRSMALFDRWMWRAQVT